MSFIFCDSEIEELPENFNTLNIKDMRGMFYKSIIKELPNNLNFTNATNIKGIFLESKLSEKGYNQLLINLNKQKLNPDLELDVKDLGLKVISKKSLLAKTSIKEKTQIYIKNII